MTTRVESIFIMVLLAAAGVSSLTAHAQVSARPDPGDPGTPGLSDKPDSAFKGYKPFREQPLRSWKEANQEVADNPGMGSMANVPGMNMPGMKMPGMNMPGMESKGAAAAGGKAEHAMPGMGAMPGMNMPGMDSKGAAAAHGKPGGAMQGMGSIPAMGSMPGMNMAGAEPKHGHEGVAKSGGSMPGMDAAGIAPKNEHAPAAHGGSMPGMAMPGMGSKSDGSETASLTGTGVVRGLDKPGARIKLTHDPIAAVSWPQMTIVFRVKNASLIEQVKQGDKVKFVLTKSSAGYVISDIQSVASSATNQTK